MARTPRDERRYQRAVELSQVLTAEEAAWVEMKLAQIAELEELMSDGLQTRPIPMADAIRLGLVKREQLN